MESAQLLGSQAKYRSALSGELSTSLFKAYLAVRKATEALCDPLEIEDYSVQSMLEASPAKWHLGHTSWFFETLVLAPALRGYQPFDPRFAFLFNSYYNALGARIDRGARGLLTRPTVREVYAYRRHVDGRMGELLDRIEEGRLEELGPRILLGLNHEQQHQELLLTDLKHAFWCNPLHPTYREARPVGREGAVALTWMGYGEGLHSIGYHGLGFSYDNERPRHRLFLQPFQLASRPVTNEEYLGFIEEGGYGRPELWLSEGWDAVRRNGWVAPLYWEKRDGKWAEFTLGGSRPLHPEAPVCHVSHFEADAYARWAGARLPTEAEWEVAATPAEVEGNFVEEGYLQPVPAGVDAPALAQIFGDVWEWTSSPYVPYPGFEPEAGAAAEYNGKFMANQMVLRGGSCASPRSHLRVTYRNYFHPHERWQFGGIRLAKNL